ncbi:MAG: GGDEF domain-containing protein [Archangium sp.]
MAGAYRSQMGKGPDDQLLDTLAGVVRDYGRFSFDLERQDARKTQALFDQWSQHLLTGIAPPSGGAAGAGAKAFAELRAQFTAQRKQEQSEFTLSVDGLRDVVWTFISSLNREASASDVADQKLNESMGHLSAAMQNAPAADVRKLALDAVKQVQTALQVRRERQEKQLSALAAKLSSVTSQLEVARREANTDGLTQLFNRKAFDVRFEQTSEFAMISGTPAAVLLFDIDHFKKVNDTYGHPAGDAILKAVANAAARAFRGRSDFVARYGGEEMVALISELPHGEAMKAAERLREAIASLRVPWAGEQLGVTVSVGVATRERGEISSAWLARADAALYRAKKLGRNRVEG